MTDPISRIVILEAMTECKNPRPIEAIHALRDSGISLLHAKRVYEMLAFGPAIVQLPAIQDFWAFHRNLEAAGVHIRSSHESLEDLLS